MTPTIRPFEPRDRDAAFRLWAATEGLGTGPGDTPEAIARFLERNPGLSLVAEAGGALVAAVLCGHDGRRGYIYRLAVARAHRRAGLATTLARRCLEGLRASRIERCQVFVEADNGVAAAFWESVRGRRRDDLIVLSIDLDPSAPSSEEP
jgi:ribosomal protein S18 acetylase RimI-like enzyme